MKRIYFLIALLIAFAADTYAQRSVNLQITHEVTNGRKFLASGTNPVRDSVWFTVKNLGPDAMLPIDTMVIQTPLGFRFWWRAAKTTAPVHPGGLPKDSSIRLYYAFNLTPAQGVKSGVNNSFQWCDSVFIYTGTAAIPDPSAANNEVCNTVQMTFWATSVNDVATIEQSFDVYPNPVTNAFKFKFDFGNSANGSVVIRDLTGKVVSNKELGQLSGVREFTMDTDGLASGMYFVELSANDVKKVAKISVQK